MKVRDVGSGVKVWSVKFHTQLACICCWEGGSTSSNWTTSELSSLLACLQYNL